MVLLTSQYTLKPGTVAPDFELPGIDGKVYSLPKLAGHKALLVIFMCNHCPYVKPKMAYIARLQDTYGPKGLQVVAINPNDPSAYSEDSADGMRKVAQVHGFQFPYLIDETQEIAKAYGAVCTPDPFLFNSRLELVYHGRLDDAHGKDPASARTHEMEEAIRQLLAGKAVTVPVQPGMGCSIKWKPGSNVL